MHDERAPGGSSQRTAAHGSARSIADSTADSTDHAAAGATTRPTATPRKAAMDLLARREHSVQELCWKLVRRFPIEEAAEAVKQLTKEGLQSDERFAESFARERFLRAYGPRRIRAELQQRGVSDDLIGPALGKVAGEEGRSWTDLAREALRRRFGDRTSPNLRDKARRLRFLYQRGFDSDVLRGDSLFEGNEPGYGVGPDGSL